MSTTARAARIALLIAVIGSVAGGLLLGAANLGIWMQGASLHRTPGINASTVGLASSPIPALAWIIYLWTRSSSPPHP